MVFSHESHDWFHTAIVYHGPEGGISVYINGSLVETDSFGPDHSHEETTGNVVLGRTYAMKDRRYANVTVDELMFWDKPLSTDVIQKLYNLY